MPVNTLYYGNPDTWTTAQTTNQNGYISVKIPTVNESDTTAVNSGSFQYLFGAEFENTGNAEITLDKSFAYIAMDKNAPQNKQEFSSCYISNTTDSEKYGYVKVIPTKNVPFGWMLTANVNPFVQFSYTAAQSFSDSPINYKPVWLSPTWLPQIGTAYNKYYLRYNSYNSAPVLSWGNYKQLKLVPLIYCAKLKAGKTIADLENAITIADINYTVEDYRTYDMKTYLTGTIYSDGETVNVKDLYPVIFQIGCVIAKINFENGVAVGYEIIDGAANYTESGKGTFSPANMYEEKFTFDSLYKMTNNNYGDKIENFSCDMSLSRGYPSQGTSVYKKSVVSGTSTQTEMMGIGGSGHWVLSGCVGGYSMTVVNRYYLRQTLIDRESWNVNENNTGGGAYYGNYFVFAYQTITGFGGENAFREYVRKMLAYFGMFFSDGFVNDVPENENMTTTGIFLGTVDENGITHGFYTEGENNPDNLNYTWENPEEDTPYNPGGESPETEIPSDILQLNTYAENGFSVGSNFYALRKTDIDDITDWINWYMNYENAAAAAAAAGNPYEQYFNDKFKTPADWYAYVYAMAGNGVHPNNDIVSLMVFPFELTGTDTGYKLGSWETDIYHNYFQLLQDTPILTGKKITGDGYKILNFGNGTVTFEGLTGDFRDVLPYTRLELQIPYHGTITLDTGDWINHEISITVICDIMTGASLAVVCRDSAPMYTVAGQLGIPVPLTVDNFSQTSNTLTALSSTVQSGFVNAVNDVLQGAASAVSGAAGAVASGLTGNLPGVVSGAVGTLSGEWNTVAKTINNVINMKQNFYDMQHTVNGKMIIGSAAPSVNVKYETKCRLVWHYPKTIKDSGKNNFMKIAGCACNITATVGDFTGGFAQFGAIDLTGISATDEEKNIILNALQNGVFV